MNKEAKSKNHRSNSRERIAEKGLTLGICNLPFIEHVLHVFGGFN